MKGKEVRLIYRAIKDNSKDKSSEYMVKSSSEYIWFQNSRLK